MGDGRASRNEEGGGKAAGKADCTPPSAAFSINLEALSVRFKSDFSFKGTSPFLLNPPQPAADARGGSRGGGPDGRQSKRHPRPPRLPHLPLAARGSSGLIQGCARAAQSDDTGAVPVPRVHLPFQRL